MFEPDEAVSRNKYEILKIWVPTHGVVNVYRKPGSLAGTSALEGLLMQCARRPVLIEKFFFFLQNIMLISIAVDQSEVWVDDPK